MYETKIAGGAPSSASLSANGDKYQGNVANIFDDKGVLSWVFLTVISEPYCNVKVMVTQLMCQFLSEIELVS